MFKQVCILLVALTICYAQDGKSPKPILPIEAGRLEQELSDDDLAKALAADELSTKPVCKVPLPFLPISVSIKKSCFPKQPSSRTLMSFNRTVPIIIPQTE